MELYFHSISLDFVSSKMEDLLTFIKYKKNKVIYFVPQKNR